MEQNKGLMGELEMAVLTDKELAHVLATIAEIDDVEQRHRLMDKTMVNLLRRLCYHKAMDIYEKTEKWYA